MKRNCTLALLVLTAALCVVATGCGSRKDPATDNNGTTSSNTAQDTMNNGSNSNGNGSGSSSSIMDEAGQGLEHAGDAIMDGVENAGDAITGNNNGTTNNGASSSHNGATSGVPYDQMLRDGKVTDRDGNLNNNASGTSSMARSR